MVGPGVGQGFQFYLQNYFWVSPLVVVGYSTPIIRSLDVSVLPVSGGVVTIRGSHFGSSQCLAAALPSWVRVFVSVPNDISGASAVAEVGVVTASAPASDMVWLNCTVLDWSNDTISVAVPAGIDANVTLQVAVGEQLASTSALSYRQPVLVNVTRQLLPTVGGVPLSITVDNLPVDARWPVAVTIRGNPCSGVTRVGSVITCIAPRGFGSTADLVVHTPRQRSENPLLLTVSYLSPSAERFFTPNHRPIEGGFPVEIRGAV
jgi:hypothetical protein